MTEKKSMDNINKIAKKSLSLYKHLVIQHELTYRSTSLISQDL